MVGITLGPARRAITAEQVDNVLSFIANLVLAFPVILLFYLLVTPGIHPRCADPLHAGRPALHLPGHLLRARFFYTRYQARRQFHVACNRQMTISPGHMDAGYYARFQRFHWCRRLRNNGDLAYVGAFFDLPVFKMHAGSNRASSTCFVAVVFASSPGDCSASRGCRVMDIKIARLCQPPPRRAARSPLVHHAVGSASPTHAARWSSMPVCACGYTRLTILLGTLG
ncbi:MAG: hypothetical protein ACN6I5_08315 [Hyphomicrobiales bacterium]